MTDIPGETWLMVQRMSEQEATITSLRAELATANRDAQMWFKSAQELTTQVAGLRAEVAAQAERIAGDAALRIELRRIHAEEVASLTQERDALRERLELREGEIVGLHMSWGADIVHFNAQVAALTHALAHPLPKSLAERAAEMHNQVWTDADIERLANDVGNAND